MFGNRLLESTENDTENIFKFYDLNQRMIFDEYYLNHPELTVTIERTSPKAALEEFLKKYPEKERWRLFVDGKMYAKAPPKFFWPYVNHALSADIALQARVKETNEPQFCNDSLGWLKYEEKEPGSVIACLYALVFALSKFSGERNNIDLLKGIHYRIMSPLITRENCEPGKFRYSTANRFRLAIPYTRTEKGIKDLIDQIANGELAGAELEAKAATQALLQKSKSNDMNYARYRPIFDAVEQRSYNQYIYNESVLKSLKAQFPQDYEAYFSDLSKEALNERNAIDYHAYATQFVRNIVNIKLKLWDELSLPKALRRLSELIFPNSVSGEKDFIEMDDFLTTDLKYSKIQEILTKIVFEDAPLSLLDDSIIKDYFEFVIEENSHWEEPIRKRLINNADLLKEHNFEFNDKTLISVCLKRVAYLTLDAGFNYIAYKKIYEKITIALETVWQKYHNGIKTAKTNDEILHIISKTIQSFERIHPFGDGNGRTFANVLLTLLLLENGFPPATFIDPNYFDVYDNLVPVIKRGIANTLEIYQCYDEKKEVNLFGFLTDELDAQLTSKSINYNLASGRTLESLTMSSLLNELHRLCGQDEAIVSFYKISTKQNHLFFTQQQCPSKDNQNGETLMPPIDNLPRCT